MGLVSLYGFSAHSRVCVRVCILSRDVPLPSAEWLILLGYRMKTSSWTIMTAEQNRLLKQTKDVCLKWIEYL